jgi:hypothetical protein
MLLLVGCSSQASTVLSEGAAAAGERKESRREVSALARLLQAQAAGARSGTLIP